LFQLFEKQCKKIWPTCLLAIYPLWFMWPTLGWGSLTMIQQYSQLDTSGMVRTAQMLSRMPTPWSTNFMSNAPQGESFWSVPALSQSFQLIVQWILVRVVPPTTAVNYWILLGWVLTGFVVYLLAIQIGVPKIFAVFSGISCEMLPWIREQVNTHTSYVFICVPLFVLYASINWINSNTKRNTLLLVSSIFVALSFDLYWAYFSLFIVLIVAMVNIGRVRDLFNTLNLRTKLAVYSILVSAALASVTGFFVVRQILVSSGSLFRPLAVGDIRFIDEFNGSVVRYATPDLFHRFAASSVQKTGTREDVITYAGIIIIGLSAVGLLSFRKIGQLRGKEHLWVIAFFTLLTIPSKWDIGILEIQTPINWLRFLMPGVRVFSRAGLIVEPLISVFAGLGLYFIVRQLDSQIVKRLILSAATVLVILDFNPSARRFINKDAIHYTEINKSLEKIPNPVIAEFPMDLNKSYFPVHYIDAPKASSLSNDSYSDYLMLAASLGEENLAAYLKNIGVTHIVVPIDSEGNAVLRYKWEARASIEINLDDSRFRMISKSGGKNPAALIEVRASEGDEFCTNCEPYRIEWSGAREGFYRFISDGKNVFYEDGQDLSWAHPSDKPKLRVNSVWNNDSTYRLTIHFVAAFGENAPPQVLAISDGKSFHSIELVAGQGTDFQVDLKSGQEVTIQSVLPCAKVSVVDPGNPDARTLCFGITSIRVEQQ
jgi:hypothetical protein